MSRSNGTRRVNKADGTKKRAKKQMTRSIRADAKKIIERSNRAIDELNRPGSYVSDMVKLLTFLEFHEFPFEQGSNDGIHPYIFISFDDNGEVTDPY